MFHPHTVQSRSLHNLQASRVLHVSDPPFSTPDESEDEHRQIQGDLGLEITTLMGKLNVNQEPEALSPNCSDGTGHFHIDPISGHIAAVTLDPQQSARLRPHADDM